MTTTSPYEAPGTESEMPTPPLAQRSTIPKVFGIINIVFAVLGSLGSLIGVVSVFGMGAMAGVLEDKTFDKLADAMSIYKPYVIADAVFKVVLGVLLLVAGIKLVKYRVQGAKLTKIWAMIRIVWAVGFTVVSYGAMAEYQQAVSSMQNLGGVSAVAGQGQVVMIIQMVIGTAMVCVYPILSMIFLRREDVQKSLS
jgi:hypothetical protein